MKTARWNFVWGVIWAWLSQPKQRLVLSTEGHWRHCEQLQVLVRWLTGEGS